MTILLSVIAIVSVALAGFFWVRHTRREHLAQARILDLEKQVAGLEAEKQFLKEQAFNREESEKKLKLHFENLAHEILAVQSKKMTEQGEKVFGDLLEPLKERLKDFEKKVGDTYQNESRERFALKEEIKRLAELNQKITLETTQLTQALKGDVKMQGNWGEVILEMILERAGLQEGLEYVTQGRDLGLKTGEGKRMQPDVIINLPDGKHLIIDSKCTLTHYERCTNADDEGNREQYSKAFLQSVYQHVDGLGAKHYENLAQLQPPDFVILFMPVEPAFALANRLDPSLFAYAWERKIVMVAPSTLLATLKTVAALWKTDRQNKNAQEIARYGGALYDKFVLFLSDLEGIGKSLAGAQATYEEAMGKIKTGRGNLLARVEHLKKLGAKTSKQIETRLVEQSQSISGGDLADVAPLLSVEGKR